MNDAERQTKLYSDIWTQDPNYGTAAHDVFDTVIHRIVPHMDRVLIGLLPGGVVVDFGAGDGRFLYALREYADIHFGIGVDLVAPQKGPGWLSWEQVPMWESKARGHYAISTDALEHLPPARVDDSLRAIAAAAPHGFLRISLKEDRYGTDRGLHLHESVFSSGEWVNRLRSAGIEPQSVRIYYDAPYASEAALEVWY